MAIIDQHELFAKLQPFFDNAIQDPVSGINNWDDLDCLSGHTRVEDIYADPDGLIIKGSKFSGIGEVIVELSFGGARDRTSFGDSFPVTYVGEVSKDDTIHVTSLTVDTSSYYE